MAVLARRIQAPPRALELGRRLADRPGLVLLGPGFGPGVRYVACDPVDEATGFDPEPALAVDPGAGPLGTVPRWVGLLPYEACRHLERPRRAGARDLRPAPRHAERVRLALGRIAAGEIYQVNLARRFELALEGPTLELFAALERAAPAPYGLALALGDLGCVGGSPELCLRTTSGGRVLTAPIKGTRPRGVDAVSDAALVAALEQDPKERAELVMVVDLERNDLGRVALPGSVCVLGPARVVTHPTVHHRVAVVTARLRPGLSRADLLAAMLPSGSVTGAPKVRAMELVAELEAHRRGLYTGAYGVLRRDGTLLLAMAIRTLVRSGEEGHYFAGGGIVADSEPGQELMETAWKSRQLGALCGDPIPFGPVAEPGPDRQKLGRLLPES